VLPDTVHRGIGRWPLASGVLLSLTRGSRAHRTLYTGCRGSPVHASGACWDVRAILRGCLTGHRTHRSESGAQRPVLVRFAGLSAHEFGEHRTCPVLRVWWGRVFAELSTHVTGEYRTRPMLTWSRPVVYKWPLEFDARDSKVDTWPTLEHRTRGVERSVVPFCASGAPDFCPVTEPTALSLWGAYKYEVAGFERFGLAHFDYLRHKMS